MYLDLEVQLDFLLVVGMAHQFGVQLRHPLHLRSTSAPTRKESTVP
jgi:hypothetical protein